MPFFEPAKNKSGCVSLQVQKPLKKQKKYKYSARKRVYPFISSGSITVEATIALSIFMLFMLFILSFMMIMNMHISVQTSIDNIVKEETKRKYYLNMAGETAEKSKVWNEVIAKVNNKINGSENSDILQPNEVKEIIKSGTEAIYFTQRIKRELGEGFFENRICKVEDFNLRNSCIKDDVVDIVVEYKINLPYINKKLSVIQRGRMREWTGQDISENGEVVYITKTGSVYHRTKECSHLIVKIRKVNYSQIVNLRNDSGQKYEKCMLCVKNKLSDSMGVFITEDGDRYHGDLKCSGIKRNVIAIDISQIEERAPCSGCGGQENE